jgi:hypothetical protein
MHVHFPADWKKDDKRPAIVFFFGGGWTSGTVKQFEPQAAYLASRGLVAARADYRVKSRHEVTPDACVEDARSAVRWLRQNAEKYRLFEEVSPITHVTKDALPEPTGFDPPDKLDAFLDAVRWGAASTADVKNIQAPFRSGIDIEDCQPDAR